jgi:hypothetical protein
MPTLYINLLKLNYGKGGTDIRTSPQLQVANLTSMSGE